jgi:carboxypeptidase PM20D1
MRNIDDALLSLQKAVQYKTISNTENSKIDYGPYDDFLEHLKKTYVEVFRKTTVTWINTYSPIFHLKGTGKEAPVLLLGHYDVVPVAEGTEHDWSHDPFGGEVSEGYLYARGTLDDKNQVVSILEALENLLMEGYVPARDFYIAFGFDEEVGGERGAREIAAYFKSQNLKFFMVLDEGGAVMEDVIEGVSVPLALVGVAEKGSSMIRMTVRGEGGHSSMPPNLIVTETMAKAILALASMPMEAKLTGAVEAMFKGIGPHMGWKGKLVGNLKSTFPLVKKTLEKSATMNSLIRTTITPTVVQSGNAYNVIPQEATIILNARILPGDTTEDVIRHLEKIHEGLPMQYQYLVKEEASKVTDHESEAFMLLKQLINTVFEDAVVLPYLMAGGTDSRKYEDLSENILRFSAVKMENSDLGRIHGTDERISIENLDKMITFYRNLFLFFS